MSAPPDHSVNAGILKDDFSFRFVSVDEAVRHLFRPGEGDLLAKFDVKAAYRNILIHPDVRFLLGMKWRGRYFVFFWVAFGAIYIQRRCGSR